MALLWPLARGLESLLFGVSPRDLLTIASSASILLIVGLLAAAGPTHRAVRVDPASALRSD